MTVGVVALTLAGLLVLPLGIARVFRAAARRRALRRPPVDRQPPPGCWWDGEQWQPPHVPRDER